MLQSINHHCSVISAFTGISSFLFFFTYILETFKSADICTRFSDLFDVYIYYTNFRTVDGVWNYGAIRSHSTCMGCR